MSGATKIIKLLYIIIISLCFLNINTANADEHIITSSPISLLFIQSAESGSIAPIPDKPGHYRLTLDYVDPFVVFFADRPSRVTGKMVLSRYLQTWQPGHNSFFDSNPNAGLISMVGNHTRNAYHAVVVLSNPKYNEQLQILTYEVRIIDDNKVSKVLNLYKPTLFIDAYVDCHRWCERHGNDFSCRRHCVTRP